MLTSAGDEIVNARFSAKEKRASRLLIPRRVNVMDLVMPVNGAELKHFRNNPLRVQLGLSSNRPGGAALQHPVKCKWHVSVGIAAAQGAVGKQAASARSISKLGIFYVAAILLGGADSRREIGSHY